jgi:protein-tyrosine phosphatase
VTRHDFQHFSHIIALDLQTLAALEAMRPTDGDAELSLCSIMSRGARVRVADPYFGEAAGFEVTWADVKIGAEALARRIADKT